MRWMVVVEFQDGTTATKEVVATNKSDAEYRAAYALEEKFQKPVLCVRRTYRS